MAAKGTYAKESVINKIKSTFGEDFVGVYDKKVYLWSEENGERVQICLSLTCPKTPIGNIEDYTVGDSINFEEPAVDRNVPEISQNEKETIANLMEKLGI